MEAIKSIKEKVNQMIRLAGSELIRPCHAKEADIFVKDWGKSAHLKVKQQRNHRHQPK